MILFLRKIVSFCLISLVVFLATDFCFSLFFRNVSEPNMEIWRDVMGGNASADILISGDSRVNTDCYPPVIDSITGLRSFSGGVIGHHFTIEKLRYDMYMRHDKKPTVIVQFVDNWVFKNMSRFDRSQFFPWMWDFAFFKGIISLEPLSFLKMTFPWFRYHGIFLEKKEWEKRKTSQGFFTYDECTPFSRISDNEQWLHRDSRVEDLFRFFLSEVSAEGIKLILVIAPMFESSSFSNESYGSFRNFFMKIADEFDVPLLDYSEMSLCEDKSLFIDAVHLNIKGAKVFSDSLANDLVSLGVISSFE